MLKMRIMMTMPILMKAFVRSFLFWAVVVLLLLLVVMMLLLLISEIFSYARKITFKSNDCCGLCEARGVICDVQRCGV